MHVAWYPAALVRKNTFLQNCSVVIILSTDMGRDKNTPNEEICVLREISKIHKRSAWVVLTTSPIKLPVARRHHSIVSLLFKTTFAQLLPPLVHSMILVASLYDVHEQWVHP